MAESTLMQLIGYLGTKDRPVSMAEFKEFWAVCSEAEREAFKRTELTPLKLTV